jgi:hypothetical protein
LEATPPALLYVATDVVKLAGCYAAVVASVVDAWRHKAL